MTKNNNNNHQKLSIAAQSSLTLFQRKCLLCKKNFCAGNASTTPGARRISAAAMLIWALMVMSPLAMAQGEIFGGGSEQPSEEEADPMAAEMTEEAISERLQETQAGIAKASNQAIRSQWEQTTEILQLQLELLEALEEDYPTEALEHPEGTPPFPLAYLDQIRHKYRYFNTVHKQLDKGHQAAQNRIKVAGETYTGARQQLTTIEEEGGTAEQNELADIQYRLAMESYIYARLDARVLNLKLTQSYQNLERFGLALPEIEQDVYLSEEDFARQLKDIDEREQMLNDSMRATRRDLMSERRKPKDARVHSSALDSLQSLLREALSYLHFEHTVWGQRKKLYLDEASEEEIVAWHEENTLKRSEIIELLQVKELAQQKHAKVLVEQEQQDSLVSAPVNVELQKDLLLRRQLAFDNLGRIIELLQDHLADLERVREIDKLKFLKAKVRHTADSIWNMQLAVIQDRTITVGKAVSAIALFMIGFVIARFLILKSLYFLLRQIRVREAVAYTVSQLLFYLLLLVLLFGVISYVGIPLRIFAFFGGALAIAAGFGSQKIISNFLSGIVLLLEGSIRVGDTVQVDDSKGRVKSIGLRHIQMTTFNNVDILIPNAKFLEENVINWTLESETIRSDFALGVDFTAPLDVVQGTLVQVALDHPEVMDKPPPEAFLEHVNNDAGYLRFNLYYWHTMHSPRERLLINSALQTEIIHRLRAKGIELASPTQDIITHSGAPAV